MNDRQSVGTPVPAVLLKMAVFNGAEEIVLRFLNSGGDVNLVDAAGQSLLMLAASRGHAHLCQLLLGAGADVALRDPRGRDAVTIANESGHGEVARYLSEYYRKSDRQNEHSVSEEQAAEDATSGEEIVDLSAWEEESLPITVNDDSNNLVVIARSVHHRISSHVPTSTDAEWNDIEIGLPAIKNQIAVFESVASRERVSPSGQRTEGDAIIRSRLDEISTRIGSCATLLDLMADPVTFGVSYRRIKAQYESWRGDFERRHSARSTTARSPSATSAFEQARAENLHGSSNKAGADATESLQRNSTSSNSTGRPLLSTWAARVWAVADDLAARNRTQPILLEVMEHPGTKGLSYKTIKSEFVRWVDHVRANGPPSSSAGFVARNEPPHRSRPERATQAGAIWAAADILAKGEPARVGIATLTAYPTLEGYSREMIATQFDRWRQFHGLPPASQLQSTGVNQGSSITKEGGGSGPKAGSPKAPRRRPISPNANWEEQARYLAGGADVTVKDMRPMKGYFWVLAGTINTAKLRTLARKLTELEFEHVDGFGFRRR